MTIPRASSSKNVHRQKWLCFQIVVLVMFLITRSSCANDGRQYIQFDQPPIPSYPKDSDFASGSIDLGGLRVYEAQHFTKIWAVNEGGHNNQGTSFYEPASSPEGYYPLGHFSRPTSKPIYASVLMAQDTTGDPNHPALAKPIAYALIWTSVGVSISKDGEGYIWLPICPYGYKAVGQIVTTSPDMPSVDLIRVVREDMTAMLEVDQWVWGNDGFDIQTTKPVDRGVNSLSVPVGTFRAIDVPALSSAIACLKKARPNKSSMPNIPQIRAMVEAYSPSVYFHPNEEYLPSSVEWFFANGALLYRKGQSGGKPITPHGWNLPLKGSIDDSYMDIPTDRTTRDRVKKGDLQYAKAYVHVKPAFAGTYTDLAIWFYYPFNGPSHFQLGPWTIKFKRIGEHVSDWEHLTLRVDNFNGGLKCIYLSQHNRGIWVNSMEFDYEAGRPIAYSSLHGHAFHTGEGRFLHWKSSVVVINNLNFQEKTFGFGVRDDTGKGKKMDVHMQYEILQSDPNTLLRQAWLYYPGRWGPKFGYITMDDIKSATRGFPVEQKDDARQALRVIPSELLGEEGPQGPMMKDSWAGDERV